MKSSVFTFLLFNPGYNNSASNITATGSNWI